MIIRHFFAFAILAGSLDNLRFCLFERPEVDQMPIHVFFDSLYQSAHDPLPIETLNLRIRIAESDVAQLNLNVALHKMTPEPAPGYGALQPTNFHSTLANYEH